MISFQQDTVQGAVLSFTNEGGIQQQASFGEIREWHHEHTVAAAQQATSQVQRAQEWWQVARAVHHPIKADVSIPWQVRGTNRGMTLLPSASRTG
jgi:hypothetical protein